MCLWCVWVHAVAATLQQVSFVLLSFPTAINHSGVVLDRVWYGDAAHEFQFSEMNASLLEPGVFRATTGIGASFLHRLVSCSRWIV